eukprot:8759982-Lingulodinium_polyedra.AAC.1
MPAAAAAGRVPVARERGGPRARRCPRRGRSRRSAPGRPCSPGMCSGIAPRVRGRRPSRWPSGTRVSRGFGTAF